MRSWANCRLKWWIYCLQLIYWRHSAANNTHTNNYCTAARILHHNHPLLLVVGWYPVASSVRWNNFQYILQRYSGEGPVQITHYQNIVSLSSCVCLCGSLKRPNGITNEINGKLPYPGVEIVFCLTANKGSTRCLHWTGRSSQENAWYC